MNDQTDKTLDDFVLASFRLNCLDISNGDLKAIVAHVRALAHAFWLLDSFDLPDDLNPAPIFKPR